MSSGNEKIWKILSDLDPEKVCKEAQTSYDSAAGLYRLKSFGMDIYISPEEKNIFSNASGSERLLKELAEHSILSTLWYLTGAKNIPLSGQLVRPDNLKGGHLFSKGTHVLPLDKIAEKYTGNIDAFLLKSRSLGSTQLEYGDVSVQLLPFPRMPVAFILWEGDNEFSPRADLLFDSTSEFQAPIDILWSTAMMTVLIML